MDLAEDVLRVDLPLRESNRAGLKTWENLLPYLSKRELYFLRGSDLGGDQEALATLLAANNRMCLTPLDWRTLLVVPNAMVDGTGSSFCFLNIENNKFIDARGWSQLEWGASPIEARANHQIRLSRLSFIKSALGLSNADLARICRISRTQLYKWLSASSAVQLTQSNWQRIADLHRIAEEWQQISTKPASELLHERLNQGTTLLTLLAARPLDHEAIHGALRDVAKLVTQIPLRPDERLREAGVVSRPPKGKIAWDE